jgi:hypothetical protein
MKLWGHPKQKVLFWSIEFVPFGPPIYMKGGQHLPKHMGSKCGAMENMLGNKFGTWGTY